MASSKEIEIDPPAWDATFPDDRIAHLVGGVARAFGRAMQAKLDAHAIPISYWKYLRVLWKEDGITQQELSNRAGLTPAMTSGAMKGMRQLEYIVWARLPSNKKNIYVYLTPKGRALKQKLIPLAEELNEIGLRSLTASEIEVARKALITMFKNLVEHQEALDQMEASPRVSARALGRGAGRR